MLSNQNGRSTGEIVQTTDEDGQVHYFEKVEELEVDGQQYALLIYQGTEEEFEKMEANGKAPGGDGDEDDEEGYEEEIILMRISKEDDADVYEPIDDQGEFEKVLRHLETISGDDVEFEVIEADADADEDAAEEED
ncbi:MAG: DUF1292 domain-containing protein [Candidatus Melainabacteria bacterium]|nr:DUF1292 domain-containing protein [Candidatus Melainabacteria bacterium]